MKKNINIWIGIVILLLLLIIMMQIIFIAKNKSTYDFGNFEINKNNLGSISETMKTKGFDVYELCEISSGKCVNIGKLKQEKKNG